MTTPTLEELADDVAIIKRKIKRMEDAGAMETLLILAARRDSLEALERIPKIEDDVRTLRVEVRTGFAAVREDISGLRKDTTDLREEMNQRFDDQGALIKGQGELIKKIADHLGIK